MHLSKEECHNAALVLEQTKRAVHEKDTLKLKHLSNRTIHSSCSFQNPGSITTAVIIYTLSKLIERKDHTKIKNWDSFIIKFNSNLDLAIQALEDDNQRAYEKYIRRSRSQLESLSINLKPYIQKVLRRASINKASKIHEHGISLSQTASLLGITHWELAEYTGQRIPDSPLSLTKSVKHRAKMAYNFFQK
jgi:hypothetical protein